MAKNTQKVSKEQIRTYLFGWLWVEENIMKEVREKIKEHGKVEVLINA